MQTYQNQLANAAGAGSSMASFVARLMSLNQQELQCLHSDSELMRQLTETQLLMESRLQHIHLQNKLHLFHHNQLPQVAYLDHYYNQLAHQHQLDQQHQLQLDQQQQHHNQQAAHQLALDLRTQQQQQLVQQHHQHQQNQWPQPAHCLFAGSPTNSQSPNQQLTSPTGCLNPKKLKLTEYQRSQQQESSTSAGNCQQRADKRLKSFDFNATAVTSPSETSSFQQTGHQVLSAQVSPIAHISQPKKYKGEFDEPSPDEVDQREAVLTSQPSYHQIDRCACVLGSEFHDKTVQSVLEMIDRWRRMPTEERIRTKWDLADLPKDIPLSDIKKYEELRREASNGRADFGGASKRKPLGIRGTRQFLLILYCLWGHPGREDPMQKEGYCPHCFAKIKKANEQSTLVRVVNHFNMKHRRGANPRLSPHRDTPAGIGSNPNQPQPAQQQQSTSNAPRQTALLKGGSAAVVEHTDSPASSPVSSTTGEPQESAGVGTPDTEEPREPKGEISKLEPERASCTKQQLRQAHLMPELKLEAEAIT